MENDLEIVAKKFIANPEKFQLFRGERNSKGGLHFTTDENWAKSFGDNPLHGTLPPRSSIHFLNIDDFEHAANNGFSSEMQLWQSLFDKGYDALVGHDSMNSLMLDVIINPKHLDRFKISGSN